MIRVKDRPAPRVYRYRAPQLETNQQLKWITVFFIAFGLSVMVGSLTLIWFADPLMQISIR